MENLFECPTCGESENLHFNYDYSKAERPIKDVVCNKCGVFFIDDIKIDTLLTKPGFVERRMAQMREINDHQWNNIYDLYDGTSDLHDFIDWLKQNYIAPEKI